jgi:carboxylate-amine ligase
MMRLVPYLPLLLALSTSSPFWQGHNTGLFGYRLAAYDELPRTGLPELFRTNDDYEEYIAALVRAGIIPDASHIWWAIRPSLKYPTIELRVSDTCTRIDDAIGIAALFRCLVRMLEREPDTNADFDRVGRALTAENKWHAQRHGIHATLVEPFRREAIGVAAWLDEILDQVTDDVDALDCLGELDQLREVARSGSSADAQIQVYQAARANGRQRLTALKDVVDWAATTTVSVVNAGAREPGTAVRASPARPGHL